MEKQLLKEYKNGNYSVLLYTDGTKEKVTEDDFFKADFPDSIDLKITNIHPAMHTQCVTGYFIHNFISFIHKRALIFHFLYINIQLFCIFFQKYSFFLLTFA